MHCYLVVFGPNDADASGAIRSAVPQHHVAVIPGKAWVIASEHPTCGDVCEAIGMVPGGLHTGVVSRMDEYNGFFSQTLWEKVNLWRGRS